MKLLCENMKAPVGVEVPNPMLSWISQLEQTAYIIVIHGDNDELLWDTGVIESNQSIHIAYGGKPLSSGMMIRYSVQVWDSCGKTESGDSTWEMGLLSHADWKAKWIKPSSYRSSWASLFRYYTEVYRMLQQDKFPSFGYMLNNGATTLWEWWEYRDSSENHPFQGGSASHNHPFKGGLATLFYSHILGIKPTKCAFKEIRIEPCPIREVESAMGSYQSLFGKISSSWRYCDNQIVYEIEIPYNTKHVLLSYIKLRVLARSYLWTLLTTDGAIM